MVMSGVLALLIIFSLFSIKPPSAAGSIAYFLGRPVWAFQRFVRGIGEDAFSILRTKAALVRENVTLREQMKELEWNILDRDRIAQELETFEKILGRSSARVFTVGKVLAKPGALPYDTFILDVGTENGVLLGDTVLVGNDIAVGTIIEVRGSISKAQLFSSAALKTPVLVGEKARAFVAHGYGAGNIVVTIPRDLEILAGEPVYLPTDPRTYLGAVDVVIERPSDAIKIVGIRLPVNLFELSQVKILHSQPVTEKSTKAPLE